MVQMYSPGVQLSDASSTVICHIGGKLGNELDEEMYVVSSLCSFVFAKVLDLGAAPVHLNDHTGVTTTTSTLTGKGFQDAVSCLQDNYPSLLATLENLQRWGQI